MSRYLSKRYKLSSRQENTFENGNFVFSQNPISNEKSNEQDDLFDEFERELEIECDTSSDPNLTYYKEILDNHYAFDKLYKAIVEIDNGGEILKKIIRNAPEKEPENYEIETIGISSIGDWSTRNFGFDITDLLNEIVDHISLNDYKFIYNITCKTYDICTSVGKYEKDRNIQKLIEHLKFWLIDIIFYENVKNVPFNAIKYYALLRSCNQEIINILTI